MHIILAIIASFVIIVGALTFMSSSEEAAVSHDYEPLRMSSIMIVAGMFCLMFFLAGLAEAVGAAVLVAIVLFVIHAVNSHASVKSCEFEAGKLQEPLPEITAAEADDEKPVELQ